MGWWQITPDGGQIKGATSMLWGDELADIMDEALIKINEAYEREWGRTPTIAELQAGLRFSLGGQ